MTDDLERPHRFAYLDPPYLGLCSRYDHNHPAGPRPFDARCWDELATHQALISWASDEFPDGWALSLSSTHLRAILPLCPDDVRVMAWIKPWAAFRPNVNPAYTWEPVIVRGGRKRTRHEPTVRDFVSANITMQKGVVGAKPVDFSVAVFAWLNVRRGDDLTDVFTGSGMVGHALDGYLNRPITEPGTLAFD